MTAAYLQRLSVLNDELVELYSQRPVVTRAYYDGRAAQIRQGVEHGLSVTAARENADALTTTLRYEVDRLEADILMRVEERDHLRFLIDHLT